jgi:glycosyltransferase involved in cell wall biosynthesis
LNWDAIVEAADVVHVHGLWLPFYHQALTAARRRKKPHLLSVHGMLEPGALQFSKWKKRAAMLLYQRKDLHLAPALHATAELELGRIRQFGLRQPAVLAPPGVPLPPEPKMTLPAGQDRRALFIGRISPIKGILTLIDAWAAVRPKGWKLDLAGPDEAGHLAEVKAKLREQKLEQEVIYHGPAFGEMKEKLLSEASLLMVPSLSENFGIVVAEGLAHHLPVITTTGMPWEVLKQKQCGWWVPVGLNPLITALNEATALPAEKLTEMGQRGRRLAEKEFSWAGIATQMSSAYAWLTGKKDRPECIRLN